MDKKNSRNKEIKEMECRAGCGACCIVPSISSPIPGSPSGKKAGIPCPHLDAQMRCMIFNSPDRPAVCAGFMPEHQVCGDSREEAIQVLSWLEGIKV
jgi:uncharacterized protein